VVLGALARGKDVAGAQANAALAERAQRKSDRAALKQAHTQLRALLESPQAAVRATVAPALARLMDLRTARRALLDAEARVRIASAAAIVRAIRRANAQPI